MAAAQGMGQRTGRLLAAWLVGPHPIIPLDPSPWGLDCLIGSCMQGLPLLLEPNHGHVYVSNFPPNFTIKKKILVTLKYRHMYGVLNVDKIKNELHSFVVLYETNVLNLISQCLENFYQIQTNVLQCSTVQYCESVCFNVLV
jgi:hypothetical protein